MLSISPTDSFTYFNHIYDLGLSTLFYYLTFLVLHGLALPYGTLFPSVCVIFYCGQAAVCFFSVEASSELDCLHVFLPRDPRILIYPGPVFANSYTIANSDSTAQWVR